MFVVTNREVDESQTDLSAFKPFPNGKGPNELRMSEASRVGKNWRIHVLPDVITSKMAKEVGLTAEVDPETNTPKPIYASRYVARKLAGRVRPVGARAKGRNFVFFVHGYNNDVGDVLDRAERLEKNFGVEVLAFTWPANGGGVRGVASYKSDQRDALASTGALDRCFDHLNRALQAIHDEHVQHIQQEADARFPNDSEKWNQFFTTQSLRWCPFTVNMLLHSMGNYLLKHTLKSSSYRGDTVIFDNVIMAAADTNNEGHAEWVDRIQCRKRIFVTINENDGALRASRMKAGEQQKARLGHYPYELNAARAVYADFTNAPHVGSEHAYFEDKALDNPGVQRFFDEALNGGTPETKLRYDVARNLHRI